MQLLRPSACFRCDGIPAESIEREKALFASQVKDMNKPANVIENIVKGKMNKFTEENTLLGQAFVKDPVKSS